MKTGKPSYEDLRKRLVIAEPIVEALKHHEVDAVVGKEKIAILLLREVGMALQSSDAGFRALFELSGVGMFQADSPGFAFTRVNRRFCEITGYTAEELRDKTYIGLTHPLDRKMTMKSLAQAIRGEIDSWAIEQRCFHKDGRVIWLSSNGAALRDESGRILKILAMITDITDRKTAEAALAARTVELRKLAAELGHAAQRERRRIARILKDHIAELLLGAKHRKAPLKASHEKTVRQALQDVQDFIDRAIAAPASRSKPAAGRHP